MNLRVATVVLITQLAALAAPAGAQPATHSPLDPVRLAADFAPGEPMPPRVLSFAVAGASPVAVDSVAAPVDSLPSGAARSAATGSAPVVGQPSVVSPIVGAVLAGAAGLYGGALAGNAIYGGDGYVEEWDEIAAVVLGATVGEVFLMPLGAHLGDDTRGSYWSALGGSALGGLATLALGAIGPAGAIIGLGIQVALTVSAERRSARHKAAERAAQGAGEAPPP